MSLLDFILSLLGDPQAKARFEANPQQVLHQNGFDGICAADVHDALPLVVDAVQQHNSFERTLDGGGNHMSPPPPPPHHHGHGDMDHAVEQIKYITQNFSYDSHNTVVDNSVNQNIWAHGDVFQAFDNHSVVSSGDHNVVGDHNAVNNGSGATSFGNGQANNVGNASADHGGAVSIGSGHATGSNDNNATDVHAYGSGNVAVAGNEGHTTQNDSHNHTDSHNSSDSHNTSDTHSTIDSGNTVASNNDIASHNTTDTHNTTDSHNWTDTSTDSHDTVASNNDIASHNHIDSHDHTVVLGL